MIFCFHRSHPSKSYKHFDNYKQYLTCKSIALVSQQGISGFIQVMIAAFQKIVVRLHFALLYAILLLRLVFYTYYTRHAK